MKIFLTGGTGFIGQPLTRALLKRGWEVTTLVRRPESAEALALQSAGAKLAPGDVTERESMRTAMAGADLVFHNAGWYELGVVGQAREKMRAINVLGTENTLGLAVELHIPKTVYTSSTTAFGDTGRVVVDESFQRTSPTLTLYEQTKTEAHAIALRYQQQGAPLVIVCPAQVIGPGDHSPYGWFARLYVRGWLPPAVWAPDAVFTMGHLDDVTEAMALAAEKGLPGQTYFLGGTVITMRGMIKTWSGTPGGFKPFLWMPRPLALLSGALSEPLLRLLGLPAFLSREVIRGSYVSFRYSSAKAERELGAKFRSAEQAWLDTLAAERTKLKNRD
jgi:nucleoside-diphosphate-sugar epimerase